MIIVRSMQDNDILRVAYIHSKCFSRQMLSEQWISCNFRAFPRIRYFVAEYCGEVFGYIQWTEKSGFRKDVILELEQIAVLPDGQNKGIGTALISQSLLLIKTDLAKRNACIKHILVTTRTDNKAQELYVKTLNAKPEAIIRNLFSADEVFMIARDFEI